MRSYQPSVPRQPPTGRRSSAEVSAHLDLPLGVTRVLVGDMAYEGLVSIHRPVNPDAHPDRALLERVLAGLRAI
jgi:Protein of unknown function (DUF742)